MDRRNSEAELVHSSAPDVKNPPRRKRKRWGNATTTTNDDNKNHDATTSASSAAGGHVANIEDPKAKLKAMQDSIKARLEAAKAARAASQTISVSGAVNAPRGSSSDVSPSGTSGSGLNTASLQQSIQAKLQAAKAKQKHFSESFNSNDEGPRAVKRAKHYELDLNVTGPTFTKSNPNSSSNATADSTSESAPREDQDNKIPQTNKNPYLAHIDEEGDVDDSLDNRLANRQHRSRQRRELKFVEPGKWQEIAQRRREKEQKIQEAGFLSGRKTGHSIQANTLGSDDTTTNIYGPAAVDGEEASKDPSSQDMLLPPRWDSHPDTTMPLCLEWWDVELLPSRLRKQVASAETALLNQQSKAALVQNLKQSPPSDDVDGKQDSDSGDRMVEDSKIQATSGASKITDDHDQELLRCSCWEQAALFHCKTADLVQHIVPIPCPNQTSSPDPVVHLTKKELKRQRKLRREEKQRELQDLQAAGLIPAPEPRLTLQNFIRVLGDQAFLDPSKYEQKVVAQIQARQAAHEQRNQERKLTKEQRAAKATAKLQSQVEKANQSGQIHVALFYVKNMSHPYHRTKVDLNAQQLFITGGVLECPAAACVIVEGSAQSIQKFVRLMTVRMTWTSGPDISHPDESRINGDDNDDGHDEQIVHKFDSTNRCELVWQGMVVKRHFSHFSFQSTESPEQCKKILRQKGLAHYWDQIMAVATNAQDKAISLKLAPTKLSSEKSDD